jgi:hypothetical protein
MATASVTEDYYSILGVSQFATLVAIREAYKKQALRFHPDKNRDESATSDFQRLVRAWETLKDVARRAEYDINYARAKRKRDDDREEAIARARRRREDVDRDATARWGRDPGESSAATGNSEEFPDDAGRREKVRSWKTVARDDYLSRLKAWTDVRKGHISLIVECQQLVRKHESNLDAQTKEEDSTMARKFWDTVERSGQRIPDPATILSKVMEARKTHIQSLVRARDDSQKRLAQLVLELENGRRRYEKEEDRARQGRIREALEILGPRDLNPPLFSMIDRRGRAINNWKVLSRVKSAVIFSSSLEETYEGPWHQAGEWERVVGEHECGRCGQSAFHFIPECGPARCPGCGMIVCNDCHRDLRLLREYADWIMSSDGVSRDSLFSLEFGPSDDAKTSPVNDFGFDGVGVPVGDFAY